MDYLTLRTRGNAKPEGKPKVYLTCHPEDVNPYLDETIAALHAVNDCVVYFAINMEAEFNDENWQLDLSRMQLFVVPVTFRLLTEPNRAMDSDIPFAQTNKIPILPLMIESGIDEYYSRKFGELQYLCPAGDGRDGGVAYEDKLAQYLESVLIGEELASRIRNAFDAYVFLSYRKNDRKLADDFMRMVHSDPRCRDVALWYDEFLTPGESFRENIDRALGNSKLFALLVTPNVLERRDGKPNFVMGVEYPAAYKAGLEIIAAEGEETDVVELSKHFEGLPDLLSVWDDEARTRLIEAMARCATEVNDSDPLHNYLIGLAYLKGIDVEVDVARGVLLVTQAAEAGQQEAIARLISMYGDGDGVDLDYDKAFKWAYQLYDIRRIELGAYHKGTLELAQLCSSLKDGQGDYVAAEQFAEDAWNISRKIFGESNPNTVKHLIRISFYQSRLGNTEAAVRAIEYGLDLLRNEQDNLDEFGISLLLLLESMIKGFYGDSVGGLGAVIALQNESLRTAKETFGERHPATLDAQNALATSYCLVGEYQKAAELAEEAYRIRCEVTGEQHPSTIASLSTLALARYGLGDIESAVNLEEDAYRLNAEVMGENHPNTLEILYQLAFYRFLHGEHMLAIELEERHLRLCREVLGERHPNTLASLFNLILYRRKLEGSVAVAELVEEALQLHHEVLGDFNQNTLQLLETLALIKYQQEDYASAVDLGKKAWSLYSEVFGERHPDAITQLSNLALYHSCLGDIGLAIKLEEKAWNLRCETLGEDHPDTLQSLSDLKFYQEQFDELNLTGQHE